MINQGALPAATTSAPSLASSGLAPFPRASQNPEHSFEASRDRILLTLLALDLMLMAFFVVMNSAATFDAKRGVQVAESLAPPKEDVKQDIGSDSDVRSSRTGARVAASAELRAAVADVFQDFLPQGTGVAAAADDGRVDVDMPGALTDTDSLPQDVIAGLADVLGNPPSGYRTELLIRAPGNPDKLARAARDLTAAGVAADVISVGTLAKGQGPLRFTFMLLDPGEETHAITAAAGKGRP